MRGLLITFEGTEATGKGAQVQRLIPWLQERGYTVCSLREPGGTPTGEELRHVLKHQPDCMGMDPVTELLLMNASRAELVRKIIRPSLAHGEIVLCDRFYDSTCAYQGYGRGLDLSLVRQVVDAAVGDTKPDLTFLLRIPVEVSEERRRRRNAALPFKFDRFEAAEREFFLRVQEGYDEIAAREPERFRVIDGTQTLEEVQAQIRQHVLALIRWRPATGFQRNCAGGQLFTGHVRFSALPDPQKTSARVCQIRALCVPGSRRSAAPGSPPLLAPFLPKGAARQNPKSGCHHTGPGVPSAPNRSPAN